MNSPIDFLLERFDEAAEEDAIVWNDRQFRFGWLLERVEHWSVQLSAWGVRPGQVVMLEADFSPNALALFLALADIRAVIVPLAESVRHKADEFAELAQGEARLHIDADDEVTFEMTGCVADHPLISELRRREHPGLVLFSSGSTGRSKGAVHDLSAILQKFRTVRPARRILSFFLYDHMGGVNTMLHTLSTKGCLVTVARRDPDHVLQTASRHRVQVLPASPTFLNLLLLSDAWKRYDLSTLEIVSYGTEPMSPTTLQRVREILPHVRLQQMYGLSEAGILRSKSRADDSLWIRIGGEGYETRVVNGLLEIKARSAMLGYLNAPSPFTDDGWLRTGDAVEVDGEWIRILGRSSDLINVGGEKVYPAEVEGVLQQIDGVVDAAVYGQPHPITGSIVCARVQLATTESDREFRARMRTYCASRLRPYQIPVKVSVVDEDLHGERFKKMRRPDVSP